MLSSAVAANASAADRTALKTRVGRDWSGLVGIPRVPGLVGIPRDSPGLVGIPRDVPDPSLGMSPWKDFFGASQAITRGFSGLPGMTRDPFNTCSLGNVFGIGLTDVIFPILTPSWIPKWPPQTASWPFFFGSQLR